MFIDVFVLDNLPPGQESNFGVFAEIWCLLSLADRSAFPGRYQVVK